MRRSKSLPLADAPALARDAPIRAQLGKDELTITFGFHCNLACTFCLVEDALNVYGGVDFATTEELLADPRVTSGVETILLSGGEVTIERDLERYVALARSVPSVRHVRLQTNAIRLADEGYLRRLVDAGVDQFFVSFHGATPAVCDAITQRPGSFEQIVGGMRAIAASGAELMTNTVIVESNYRELAAIADIVLPLRPTRVDFWNYLPRVDRVDVRGQLARVEDIRPHLVAALDRCAGRVPRVVVKHFPRCLLGAHAALQDDSQPTSLVDDAFWGPYPPYACVHEGVCAHAGAEGCRGLSFAYIKRFGWEEELLRPTRDERRAGGDYWSWARGDGDRRSSRDVSPAIDHRSAGVVASALGLGGEVLGWRASRVEARGELVRITLARGDDELSLEFRARDEAAPAFVRTASLNVSHGRVRAGTEEALRPLLRELGARITRADRGDVWTKIRAAPARSTGLAAWLDALPGRHHPDAERFSEALLRLVGAGAIRSDLVEASVALHDPSFRMHVNVAGDDRASATMELAEAAGLPVARLRAPIEAWLADRSREVFVGLAANEARARAKIYFRSADPGGALVQLATKFGAPGSDQAIMLGVDFVRSEPVAFKSYRLLADEAVRAAPISSFVRERARAWYRCLRSAPDGRTIDESIHAEVPGLALEEAASYARADETTAAWIRTLSPATTTIRALSETDADERQRHIYFAFRERTGS
jgi:MoaA/NifB/PqqE/SkfB family radical SAM enzyme